MDGTTDAVEGNEKDAAAHCRVREDDQRQSRRNFGSMTKLTTQTDFILYDGYFILDWYLQSDAKYPPMQMEDIMADTSNQEILSEREVAIGWA